MSPRQLRQSVRARADERLTDDAIIAYVGWREACAHVAHTYADWCRASARERNWRYTVHTLALTREDAAASRYRAALDRLGQALSSEGTSTSESRAVG
jgi:hypothetical protein